MAHEYRPAPMSLAQRAALRQQQPRQLRQPATRRVFPLVIVIVLLVALIAVVGGFEYLYRDRIYPKVQITNNAWSVNVGGQTQDAAITALGPYRVQQLFRFIVLTAPGSPSVSYQAHQLGYSIDRGTTVIRAFGMGHDGSILHRARTQVSLLVNGTTVPLVQRVDQRVLVGHLRSLAARVNRPAGPGVRGRRLNVTLAARRIRQRLLAQSGGFTVALPFTTIRALPAPRPAHPKAKHAAIHKTKKH